MTNRESPSLDQLRLSDEAARQLLARASELDATRGRMVTIANLREAAVEAGISTHAFDAALAELQQRTVTPAAHAAPRSWQWRHARAIRRTATVVAAVALALGVVFAGRAASQSRQEIVEMVVEPASDVRVELRVDTVIVTPSRAR